MRGKAGAREYQHGVRRRNGAYLSARGRGGRNRRRWNQRQRRNQLIRVAAGRAVGNGANGGAPPNPGNAGGGNGGAGPNPGNNGGGNNGGAGQNPR